MHDHDYLEKMRQWYETRPLDVTRYAPEKARSRLWRNTEGIGHLTMQCIRGYRSRDLKNPVREGYFSEGNRRLNVAYHTGVPIFPITLHRGCHDPIKPAPSARNMLLWQAAHVIRPSTRPPRVRWVGTSKAEISLEPRWQERPFASSEFKKAM